MTRNFLLTLAVAAFGSLGFVRASSIETGKLASKILGAEKEYAVYLPDGYEKGDREYPVLYLLHGASDNFRAWQQKGHVQSIADQQIRAGFSLPLIIVMPDARGVEPNNMGKNMGYFDQPDWAYEEHFFGEFVPHIEKAYRIKKEKGSRAVAGLSMGGGGTVVYAMRHPEMFSSACPMSGLVGAFGERGDALGGLWRQAADNAPVEILENAPEERLREIASVRWYIDCGDDDFLLDGNIELFQNMRDKKIPVQFRVRDGGHTWDYWQESLRAILKFISIGFAR